MKRELYRFVEGSNVTTYTSCDEEVEYNGETYTPVALGRSDAVLKNELTKANMEIKFSLDNPAARRWLANRGEAVVTLSIFEEDETSPGTFNSMWKGRLASVKPNSSELVLVFESIFTSLRRPGLRARYLRTCRHSLYGRGCNLDREDFAVEGVLTSISGLTCVVPEAASFQAGWFATGMIEAPDGSLRFITNHVGDTLTLIRPFESLVAELANSGYGMGYGLYYGQLVVRLFPGCDRRRVTCNGKFDNLPNYGGFDWIPVRNPYDGSSIV